MPVGDLPPPAGYRFNTGIGVLPQFRAAQPLGSVQAGGTGYRVVSPGVGAAEPGAAGVSVGSGATEVLGSGLSTPMSKLGMLSPGE